VKKEKAPAPVQEKKSDGPSKKELNKLAKQEKKAAYKEAAVSSESAAVPPVPPSASDTSAPVSVAVGSSAEPTQVVYFKGFEPRVAEVVAALTGSSIPFNISTAGAPHEPFLQSSNGSVSGDLSIARYFARRSAPELCFLADAWQSSQVDQWLDFLSSEPDNGALLALVNTHLSDKTFLVGSSLSLADIAVSVKLAGSQKVFANGDQFTHLSRWFALTSSRLPTTRGSKGGAASKGKAASGNAAASAADKKKAKEPESAAVEDGGSCPPLEDAVMGEVRLACA
jgi:hypothetical protein